MRLDDFKVDGLPTLHYLPAFITPLQESSLLKEIRSSRVRYTVVSGRRVQVYGGSVHDKHGLLQAPLPRWLATIVRRVSSCTRVFGSGGANHVLVNAYLPGEGIMPHEDGPLYHPAVCILSLGSPAILRFWRKGGCSEANTSHQADIDAASPIASCSGRQLAASVICEPRSLLIFQGDAYTACLHGIDFAIAETVDCSCLNAGACGLRPGDRVPRRGERTSLTIRRVLRTCGVRIKL